MIKRLAAFEALTECMKQLEQTDIPVENFFAPGLYARQITAPAGSTIVGKIHTEGHLNILLKGKARIVTPFTSFEVSAPAVYTSGPGEQKAAYVLEELVFITIHATELTNPEAIVEAVTVEKHDARTLALMCKELPLCQ